jgi:hypothetical protein
MQTQKKRCEGRWRCIGEWCIWGYDTGLVGSEQSKMEQWLKPLSERKNGLQKELVFASTAGRGRRLTETQEKNGTMLVQAFTVGRSSVRCFLMAMPVLPK